MISIKMPYQMIFSPNFVSTTNSKALIFENTVSDYSSIMSRNDQKVLELLNSWYLMSAENLARELQYWARGVLRHFKTSQGPGEQLSDIIINRIGWIFFRWELYWWWIQLGVFLLASVLTIGQYSQNCLLRQELLKLCLAIIKHDPAGSCLRF